MKRYVFKKYLCYINKLYDTRISSMLTPGCRATNSCSMLFPALFYHIYFSNGVKCNAAPPLAFSFKTSLSPAFIFL